MYAYYSLVHVYVHQMLMNVQIQCTIAVAMQSVMTQREDMNVSATRDLKGMDSSVQVCLQKTCLLLYNNFVDKVKFLY